MMQMPDYRITRDQAIECWYLDGTSIPPDDELLPDEPNDDLETVPDCPDLVVAPGDLREIWADELDDWHPEWDD